MSYFKVRNPYSEKQFLVSGAADVLASDSQGQSYASAITIDDAAPASDTNLWSSQKIADSTLAPVSPAVAGDLAALTASGLLQDSGFKVDDAAAPAASILYSSAKADTSFQKLVVPVVAGDLASLDAAGQATDSGFKVDDTAVASASILYSSAKLLAVVADKIFVRGNFDVVVVPDVTQVTLAGTPTQNVGGGWAVNVFTAPRDGYYVTGFIIQNNGAAGVNALTYWEGTCWMSSGEHYSNVTFFANPIAAANVTVAGSGAFSMLAGQQVYFTINNRTGFAQTLAAGDYNTFYIAQL